MLRYTHLWQKIDISIHHIDFGNRSRIYDGMTFISANQQMPCFIPGLSLSSFFDKLQMLKKKKKSFENIKVYKALSHLAFAASSLM